MGNPRWRKALSKTCSVWIKRAIAYIEMPEENTVMTAKVQALKTRVLSS